MFFFRFVFEVLPEEGQVFEPLFPSIDLFFFFVVKFPVFEDFAFGFVLAEFEEPDALFKLLPFFLADSGFELFLDRECELFSFGLAFDELAKSAFVGGLGLLGYVFIPLTVEKSVKFLLDFVEVIVELLFFVLQFFFE